MIQYRYTVIIFCDQILLLDFQGCAWPWFGCAYNSLALLGYILTFLILLVVRDKPKWKNQALLIRFRLEIWQVICQKISELLFD